MKKDKDLPVEDKKIWDEYTRSPSDIYDKEQDYSTSDLRKKRFKFDLHGFSLDEAHQKVREIILICVKKKYKELLLITGKGLHSTSDQDIYASKEFSKLKFSVPEFINNSKELSECIISITEATMKDGGAGAILIKLKKL